MMLLLQQMHDALALNCSRACRLLRRLLKRRNARRRAPSCHPWFSVIPPSLVVLLAAGVLCCVQACGAAKLLLAKLLLAKLLLAKLLCSCACKCGIVYG